MFGAAGGSRCDVVVLAHGSSTKTMQRRKWGEALCLVAIRVVSQISRRFSGSRGGEICCRWRRWDTQLLQLLGLGVLGWVGSLPGLISRC